MRLIEKLGKRYLILSNRKTSFFIINGLSYSIISSMWMVFPDVLYRNSEKFCLKVFVFSEEELNEISSFLESNGFTYNFVSTPWNNTPRLRKERLYWDCNDLLLSDIIPSCFQVSLNVLERHRFIDVIKKLGKERGYCTFWKIFDNTYLIA